MECLAFYILEEVKAMNKNTLLFNTKENYYIYDGNTGNIFKINPMIKNIYENNFKSNIDGTVSKEIKDSMEEIDYLKEKGFFSGYPDEIYLDNIINQAYYDLENNMEGIILSVTQNCNLRCEYCSYSGLYDNVRTHSDKVMSFEIAKKAIDKTIVRASGNKEFRISFYGGEPLLQFDLIRKCVSYVKSSYPEKEVNFSMTTNGTLLTKEKLKFLVENKFMIYISLDGPEKYHDEYRKFFNSCKGSFKTIEKNIIYIKENYPNYYKEYVSFMMTLSPFRDVDEIEEFILESDIISEDNYIRVAFVNNSQELSLYKDKKKEENIEQDRLKMEFMDLRYIHAKIHGNIDYLEKSKVALSINEDVDSFDKKRIVKKASKKILPRGCCIPGQGRLFVSVDGEFYICDKCSEKGDTLKIGDVEKGVDAKKSVKIIEDFYNATREECLRCWAYLQCGMCPVSIEDDDKQSRERKLDQCSNMKKSIETKLVKYMTIIEKNPDAFSM